jgi:hypothetical protein
VRPMTVADAAPQRVRLRGIDDAGRFLLGGAGAGPAIDPEGWDVDGNG